MRGAVRSEQRHRFASWSVRRGVGSTGDTAAGRRHGNGHAAEHLTHGSVVIAAITSCTNTSNPSVMLAAGLLAKKAVERGLSTKPWVKASLAPGSKVVTDYLKQAGLDSVARRACGSTWSATAARPASATRVRCPPAISEAIQNNDLVAVAVLSGNRNFEGRINPDVRANYLASPPLVVAYALAGTMDIDLAAEPLGNDRQGKPVYLKDIWPTQSEIQEAILKSVHTEMFQIGIRRGLRGRRALAHACRCRRATSTSGTTDSTYVKNPPYFVDMPAEPPPIAPIASARVLAVLGDSITTDHISPAGSIKADGPAGRYLIEHGVPVVGVQLLRRAARQPRGDGPGHVRQCPPAEPAGARAPRGAGRGTCPTARS